MFVVIVEKWDHEGMQEQIVVGVWTERESAEAFAKNHSSEWVECEVREMIPPIAYSHEASSL